MMAIALLVVVVAVFLASLVFSGGDENSLVELGASTLAPRSARG